MSQMCCFCGCSTFLHIDSVPLSIMDDNSHHIIAQQANRYIVAFRMAISHDTQRPRYNKRAVGLQAACMVSVTLTDRCTR